MKVYCVVFNEILSDRTDMNDAYKLNVLGEDVENAIACAVEKLGKKEKKNYDKGILYVAEVGMLNILD